MKNHLKRIAAPRSWLIKRKGTTYVIKPNSGTHSSQTGLPLAVILRDVLRKAQTGVEVKKLLCRNEIFVDGKRRKDYRFIVGLFDTLYIQSLKEYYRIGLDKRGRLSVQEIPQAEAELKLCKVVGKRILPGGKIQVNLHDGRNVFSAANVKIGDSLLLRVPSQEIQEVLSLQPGVLVFLAKGKYAGYLGTLKEIKGKQAICEIEGRPVETLMSYLFVVGEKKPQITLSVTP